MAAQKYYNYSFYSFIFLYRYRRNSKEVLQSTARENPIYNCQDKDQNAIAVDKNLEESNVTVDYARVNKEGIYKTPKSTGIVHVGNEDSVFVDNETYASEVVGSEPHTPEMVTNDEHNTDSVDLIDNNDKDEQSPQDGMVDNELYDAGPPNADNKQHVSDTSAVYLTLENPLDGSKPEYTGLHFSTNSGIRIAGVELNGNGNMPSAQDKSGGDLKRESVTDMVENDVYSQ